jgi:hypothetical protein
MGRQRIRAIPVGRRNRRKQSSRLPNVRDALTTKEMIIMPKTNQETRVELDATRKRRAAQKLEAASWGVFFIWVGICFLMDVGWGIGLLGVGLITLGGQVGRQFFGLPLEGCWVVMGLFFLLGGIWDLAKIEISLVSVALVVVGAVLVLSAVRGRYRAGGNRCCGRSEWC